VPYEAVPQNNGTQITRAQGVQSVSPKVDIFYPIFLT
jgi:hypothetical protein